MNRNSATAFFVLAVLQINCKANMKTIRLPAPRLNGTVSVEEALSKRRSVREYDETSLTLENVSQLLWAAQGISYAKNRRTSPSAGATYPLTVYLSVKNVKGLESGIYRYQVDEHSIVLLKLGDCSVALSHACWDQRFLKSAPVILILSAVYERTTQRYGERGVRYVHMECGHVGENVYLQAEALGLGTVAVGAFDDSKIQEILGIQESVLYLFPVGHSR
jgi:SagB-type dehydrogenase family enzyme